MLTKVIITFLEPINKVYSFIEPDTLELGRRQGFVDDKALNEVHVKFEVKNGRVYATLFGSNIMMRGSEKIYKHNKIEIYHDDMLTLMQEKYPFVVSILQLEDQHNDSLDSYNYEFGSSLSSAGPATLLGNLNLGSGTATLLQNLNLGAVDNSNSYDSGDGNGISDNGAIIPLDVPSFLVGSDQDSLITDNTKDSNSSSLQTDDVNSQLSSHSFIEHPASSSQGSFRPQPFSTNSVNVMKEIIEGEGGDDNEYDGNTSEEEISNKRKRKRFTDHDFGSEEEEEFYISDESSNLGSSCESSFSSSPHENEGDDKQKKKIIKVKKKIEESKIGEETTAFNSPKHKIMVDDEIVNDVERA
ncbi:4682_t:CDS:2 [Entrophospora sp. SA101]|nr:14938_t:CDS:2 [Entrophospora sp. SA101]CAJ0648033.1 7240_t:CDS:2 [Entrophospora sp. SA101]CAJ0759106.1 4682_t:CDS:2 [Entrophospora sp. SA101]CAJ0853816.1 9479_t:CDS:2 [Entrophospora sp. SA101]CAJ0912367.1 9556_t:CDS:2 [Entrophospora sp. SA101]